MGIWEKWDGVKRVGKSRGKNLPDDVVLTASAGAVCVWGWWSLLTVSVVWGETGLERDPQLSPNQLCTGPGDKIVRRPSNLFPKTDTS